MMAGFPWRGSAAGVCVARRRHVPGLRLMWLQRMRMRSSSNCTARNASDVRYFWAARHTYGVPKGALTKTTISHSPSKMMDGRGGWTISEIKGGSEEGVVLLEFPLASLSLPLCVLVGVVMSICSSAVRIALVSCFEGDAVAALAPDDSIGIALPPISALMMLLLKVKLLAQRE